VRSPVTCSGMSAGTEAPRRLAQSPMAQSKTPAGADTAGALAYGLVRRQGKPRCRAKDHAGIQSRRTGFHNSILQVAATPLYSRSLARLLLQTALAPGELRLSWVCVTRAGIIARRHGLSHGPGRMSRQENARVRPGHFRCQRRFLAACAANRCRLRFLTDRRRRFTDRAPATSRGPWL
jgi:hypothetical protein